TIAGGQTYDNPVTLSKDTVLADTGSGNIAFNSTVDSDALATPRNLTVNTAGTTIFGRSVGNSANLAALTTDAAGSTAVYGAADTYDITAGNGNLLAAKTGTLAGNTTVSSGSGSATFTGAVDADAAASNRTLAVNSSGATTFGSAVGGSQRLGSLTTDAAGTT